MNLVFHPDAAAEFEAAVRYDRARGRVLGDRFATEVRVAIRRILATPKHWRVLEEDVRRCRVLVFPYSLLYTIERDAILIVAVMHTRRQPGYWRYRVSPERE